MANKIIEVVNRIRKYAVFPMVCADHAAWLDHMDQKDAVTNAEKLAAVLEHAYRKYDYDMVLVFADPYVEAQALGCNVEFTPQPMLKEGKNEKIKVNRTAVVVKAAQILSAKVDVPVFASIKGPFTLASFLAGPEKFLTMLLKDEAKAYSYLTVAIDFQQKYLARLLAIGVNVFIGDPMASASVISPGIFKKFAFNPLKSLIKEIKATGLLAGLHICGDTRPIINDLDELGADLLSIEDITVRTRTTKMGGVSTTTILNGDQEQIKKEIEEACRGATLVISTACDVPVTTNPEHVKFMVKTSRLQA